MKAAGVSTKRETDVMDIVKMLREFVQYITEGFARIFGPNDDEYPSTGVQPYEGDPYQQSEKES
jgi:hypothetical protein